MHQVRMKMTAAFAEWFTKSTETVSSVKERRVVRLPSLSLPTCLGKRRAGVRYIRPSVEPELRS